MTTQSIKLPVEMMIAAGEASGLSSVAIFGANPDIDVVDAPEDVWDAGGTYTYTANGGAAYYFSSSNNADTQTLQISLLTENGSGDWIEETFNITLVGQTKTAITTPTGDLPVRFIRAINIGTTDLAGTVYFYEDDTVITGVPQTASKLRGQIVNGNNRTLMTHYTVPSNKRSFFMQGYITMTGDSSTQPVFEWQSRPHNSVFAVGSRVSLEATGNSWFQYKYAAPVILPAKTDLKIVVTSVGANNCRAAGGYDLIIQDV